MGAVKMTNMTRDAELADNCQKGIKFFYQSLAQQMVKKWTLQSNQPELDTELCDSPVKHI